MDISKYLTPYRYGKPVLEASGRKGAYDELAVDCPHVFFHNGRYYMLHVGFDGKGYQTGLAVSDDLFHWYDDAPIMVRGGDGWDKIGPAGGCVLRNNNLSEAPVIKKYNGKYWMFYHSYPTVGYEQGPAEIGLAWTEDETLRQWNRLPDPVLSWRNGQGWNSGGLYTMDVIEHDGKFYMFYNAKDHGRWLWTEQTGVAISEDLIHWEKYEGNPVLPCTGAGHFDGYFASDPYVACDDGKWVMYYYGFDGVRGQEGIALSDDLLHWRAYPESILKAGKDGDIDSRQAHKPSVLVRDGVLYHFYVAVRESRPETDRSVNLDSTKLDQPGQYEFRCISVAVSDPKVLPKD